MFRFFSLIKDKMPEINLYSDGFGIGAYNLRLCNGKARLLKLSTLVQSAYSLMGNVYSVEAYYADLKINDTQYYIQECGPVFDTTAGQSFRTKLKGYFNAGKCAVNMSWFTGFPQVQNFYTSPNNPDIQLDNWYSVYSKSENFNALSFIVVRHSENDCFNNPSPCKSIENCVTNGIRTILRDNPLDFKYNPDLITSEEEHFDVDSFVKYILAGSSALIACLVIFMSCKKVQQPHPPDELLESGSNDEEGLDDSEENLHGVSL